MFWTILLYGMVIIAFSIIKAWTRGFDVFLSLVKSGDFDRILLRPRTTMDWLNLHLVGSIFFIVSLGI